MQASILLSCKKPSRVQVSSQATREEGLPCPISGNGRGQPWTTPILVRLLTFLVESRRRMAWMTHPFSGWGPKLLDDPRQNPTHEAEMLRNRGRCVSQNGVHPGFYPEVKDPWCLEELSLPFSALECSVDAWTHGLFIRSGVAERD